MGESEAVPAPGGVTVDGVPVGTWLDVCLSDIHAAIEASLPQMDGSRLEARSLLERILGETPPPELLETLKQVAEAPEQSALRMGLGRLVIAMAILVRRELRVLSELDRLDPEMLRRQAETLPVLIHRVEGLENDIASMRAEGSADAPRLRKLRVSLLPSIPRLQGFATLVRSVQHLTDAALQGTLAEAGRLSDAEVAWLEAAIGRGSQPESRAPRPLLDAIALRVRLEGDLDEHWRGGSVFTRLRQDIAAYDVAAERLGGEVTRARADGLASLTRRLTAVQQELLALHRKLVAILRDDRKRPRARARSRSRAAAFVTATAVFGVVAAITFGAMRRRAEPAAEEPPSARRTADRPRVELELVKVEREGDALVAEVHALPWRQLATEERHQQVYGLGMVAFSQGAREVRFVDERGRWLATWSQAESIEMLWPDRSTSKDARLLKPAGKAGR